MDNQKKILVMGIGNLLFKDEGIGIHVVRKLMNMTLPSDVEVLDGGILVTGFYALMAERKKAIIIDAMKAGGPPGTIYRFVDSDIPEKRKGYFRTIQEMEFTNDLENARFAGTKPEEVVFIGIEPEDMGEKSQKLEIGLSPIIEGKIPEIIEMIMREIT
jgi:hydrogenase maturation protease